MACENHEGREGHEGRRPCGNGTDVWKTLVVGVGNELRSDDGIGPLVARRIDQLGLPGVRTLAVHQLTPELADAMADVHLVVLVDAHMGLLSGPIGIQRLSAGASRTNLTHVCRPETLVELTELLFGKSPEVWIVGVAAEEFGIGEGLSPFALRNADIAVEEIMQIIETHWAARSSFTIERNEL